MNKIIEEALRRDGEWARGRTRGPGVGGARAVFRALDGSSRMGSLLVRRQAEAGNYFYKRVDENDVEIHKVYAAVDILEYCMGHLKIKVINLVWYRICGSRESGASLLGPQPTKAFVLLDAEPCVCLRSDLSSNDVRIAAAHEAHHIWMESQPPDRFATLDAAEREAAANAFAYIMYDRFRERTEPNKYRTISEPVVFVTGRQGEPLRRKVLGNYQDPPER